MNDELRTDFNYKFNLRKPHKQSVGRLNDELRTFVLSLGKIYLHAVSWIKQ